MPNNLVVGNNGAVAKETIDFVTAGVTALNTAIIYEVGNPNKSFVPGRLINAITVFTANVGYYIVMLQAVDFSDFLVPPITAEPVLILQDDFTDTDDVVLTAHTMNLGGTWTRIEGTGVDNAKIATNQLIGAHVAGSAFSYIKDLAVANVRITADLIIDPVTTGESLGSIEIISRVLDIDNLIRFVFSGGDLLIVKTVATVLTTLATIPIVLPGIGTYPIEAILNGSSLSVTFHGETLNATDSFNLTQTKHGLRIYSADNIVNNKYDNLKIYTV